MREDRGDEREREFSAGVGGLKEERGAGRGGGVGAAGEFFEKIEAGGAVEAEDEGGAFFGEGAEPIQTVGLGGEGGAGGGGDGGGGLGAGELAGGECGGEGEEEAERSEPAARGLGVEPEGEPGEECVERAVRTEAAEHDKLDKHEDDGAAGHEEEECAAFATVGDKDDGEPEQGAVCADGDSQDRAVAAVDDCLAAAVADAGEIEEFEKREVGRER